MIHSAYIFRSPNEVEGIFDSFLQGLYFVKGIPLIVQLMVLTLFPLACLLAYLELVQKEARFGKVSRVLSITSLCLSVMLLIQPWDELFINLLHARNWIEAGTFSFSKLHAVEGTVDFLFYFAIGLLGKIGFPLLETTFALSLLGGILCVWVLSLLLEEYQVPYGKTWGFVFFSGFAPLCFNSSHGFSTTIFAASILWAFYLITAAKKEILGLFVLGLVPLIRMEGAWFSVLFFVLFLVPLYKKVPSKLVLAFAMAFVPFGALSLWRQLYFGSMVPPPIHFKSAFGNLFFFLIGLRNLMADLITNYAWISAVVIGVSFGVLSKKERQPFQSLFKFVALLLCFTFPYYLSGGDWFPAVWGRYLLPLSLSIFLTAIVVGNKLLPKFWGKVSQQEIIIPYLLSLPVIAVVLTTGSYPRLFEEVFTYRKTLANTQVKKTVRTNFRVQYLSELGTHLKMTSPENAVIGSSEIATISFHANRETLDLLGLTNPEIFNEPLRSPSLFRRIPKDNELPYLIFKRVNPTLVEKYRPDFIYTFDFIPKDLAEHVGYNELSNQRIFEILARWEIKFRGLLKPLYGGLENLLKLGYRPVIVTYENQFCAMYFVSSEAIANHIALMKRAGLEGGLVERGG